MGEIRSPYFSIDQDYVKDNAEIRSPYFSSGGDYLGYNAEIHSPYVSSGGDYLGDGAEIRSPYFSFGTRDYHGDNAEIHSSYSSVADYLGEDAEIPPETFFQEDNIVENPYSRESFVEQDVINVYKTEKSIQLSDVQQLVLDLAANTHSFVKKTNDEKCIFKVRQKLRGSHEAYYTPQVVSIGPFHHDKNLQIKKTHKKNYLGAFCSRAVGEKREEQENFLLGKLWATINDNENEIYGYYADAPVVQRSEFLKMVLYDAVFILEYLLRNKDFEKYEENDPVLQERGEIRGDLMMLENQLPFFILEKLYNHFLEVGKRNYISFPDIAYEYFNRYNIKSGYNPRDSKNILHFTDLIRSSLSFNLPNSKTGETNGIHYSATQLQEARIKINESPHECLLNVKFFPTKGDLLIPSLKINSYTKLLFLNLMAFELDHYGGKKYICHYIKLFDTLVANSEDANLLIKNKIILADTDGDEVKKLIEKLGAEIPGDDDTIYYKVHEQLETYYTKNFRKNKGFLRIVYFGNIWISIATVAATILLLLTVVQTICAVISLP